MPWTKTLPQIVPAPEFRAGRRRFLLCVRAQYLPAIVPRLSKRTSIPVGTRELTHFHPVPRRSLVFAHSPAPHDLASSHSAPLVTAQSTLLPRRVASRSR